MIKEVDKGMKKIDVMKKFGLKNQSTLSTILKNRDKIIGSTSVVGTTATAAFSTDRKRMRTGKYEEIEAAVLKWLQTGRAKNLPISGPLLLEKAKEFASLMDFSEADFSASQGWLERFKSRNNIVGKKMCGESAAVDPELCARWLANDLPGLIQGYHPRDIYNADETGLFFRLLPDKTLTFKNDECHGGKKAKNRITVLCTANMDGSDKLKLVVIGKHKKPRCFKNVRSKPVQYESNKKAWMLSSLFDKWIRKFDRRMVLAGRSVLMFVDNCSAHPPTSADNLKATKLLFLPANTTSQLQPMDMGIIKNMKMFYRKKLLQRCLREIDTDGVTAEHTCGQVTVLDAILMVHSAWEEVYTTPTYFFI